MAWNDVCILREYVWGTEMVPSTGALTHNEGAFVEAVLMKRLARVSSLSLLLFKVHFIINVGEKEMIPFVSLHERNKEPCSPRARTVTYLSYSTLFHWGSSIFNLSTNLPTSTVYDHPHIFIF